MDKYTLMSRAGIWNADVIKESHINESQYKVAGQPVTLNKGEASDGTDWTVTFKNNVEVPLSDVLALIDPMPSGITKTNVNEANRGKLYQAAKRGSYPGTIVVVENGKVIHQEPVATPDVAPAAFNVMQEKYPNARISLEDRSGKSLFVESINESQWVDQVPGNDEIVWVKTKEMGSKAKYTPHYRGHMFDEGGYTFGSQAEMDEFVKDYILSNQMYNKLKHKPVKPIDISEGNNSDLMDTLTSSGKLVKPDGGSSMNGQYYQLQGGTKYDIIHFDYDSNSEKPFGVAQVAGHHMPTQLLRKLGFKETNSWTAGVEVYIFDGNSSPKYISEQEMAQLVDEWSKGVSSYAKTMGDFYKDRGRTSGTVD